MEAGLRRRLRGRLRDYLDGLLQRAGYSLVHDSVNWQSTRGLDLRLADLLQAVSAKPAASEDAAASSAQSALPVIFDVGANIGRTTSRLKARLPSSRLYCFEPVPATFAELVGNVGRLEGVRPYNLALGADEGTSRIYLRENSEWNSLVPEINDYLRERDCQFVEVDRTTIDHFSQREGIDRIDLLKIDTEGYEREVLRGAAGMIAAGKIGAIYLETGFDRQQLQHSYYLDLLQQLDRDGFRFCGFFEMSIDSGNQLDFANALFVRQ